MKRAFTLIELLVVISIIALLSTVVLSSLNTAREKARLASNQQFSANVQHAIGQDTILAVMMDEATSTVVNDMSGNNRHGAISGTPAWTQNTPSGKGTALSFNGSNNYVLFPKIDADVTNAVTISAWIYPTNASSAVYQGLVGTITNGGFMTFLRVNQLFFDIVNQSAVRVFQGKGTIVDNKWQHILLSYDGTTMRWYIDGKLVGTAAQTGLITQQNAARIGYSGSGSEYFPGLIDDVRIYSSYLVQSEVERLYAEGLEKHNLATNEN